METSANGLHTNPAEDKEDHETSPRKNQSFLKKFGSLRISKRNLKKPEEEGSPEKTETPSGKDARSSKVSLKKQRNIEEPDSPDKAFGSFVSRLSKRSPNKLEKKEDVHSPESKTPSEVPGSLVNKFRRSFMGKKKLDYNEAEESPVPDDLVYEEEEEEQKMLSVMEINGLIQSKEIKKAFGNIKLMEDKLLEDCDANDFHENVTEFTIRGKDVDLLYGSLFNMMRSIVKDSLGQDHVDESLISSVVYVINKEAEIHKNPKVTPASSEIPSLGQPRGWKKLWKKAVNDSVTNQIESLPLMEGESGWLAKHLDNLKSVTVKDLKKVKNSLQPLYPEDYGVYGTYVRSFQEALALHLENTLVPLAEEFSQLYCLLDWIINQYKSDDFMADPELHVEIHPLSLRPLLEGECFEKLKADYILALQATVRKYMTNILEMEKRNWENGEEVKELVSTDSNHLPIYTDIEDIIGSHVRNSATLSEDLETSASNACVEELGRFTTRLQAAFQDTVGTSFTELFVQYTIIYVNSFMKLRHNTTQSDAEQFRCAEINLSGAIQSLKLHFFHLFKKETKPQFQKIITKKWIKKHTAFTAIMKSTGIPCRCLRHLLPPHDKEFAREIHRYLVKEYISQMMQRKMRLSRLKRKKAAETMREEGDFINKAAEDMGSDLDYLHHAIHYVAEIIGAKKNDIKAKLDQLFHLYPDISENHVLCILHLYGLRRKGGILDHFHRLQDSPRPIQSLQDNPQPGLFSEIDYSTQVTCFTLCTGGSGDFKD